MACCSGRRTSSLRQADWGRAGVLVRIVVPSRCRVLSLRAIGGASGSCWLHDRVGGGGERFHDDVRRAPRLPGPTGRASAGGRVVVILSIIMAFFMAAFFVLGRSHFKIPAVLPTCSSAVSGGLVVAFPLVSVTGRLLTGRFMAAFVSFMVAFFMGTTFSLIWEQNMVLDPSFIAAFFMAFFMSLFMAFFVGSAVVRVAVQVVSVAPGFSVSGDVRCRGG